MTLESEYGSGIVVTVALSIASGLLFIFTLLLCVCKESEKESGGVNLPKETTGRYKNVKKSERHNSENGNAFDIQNKSRNSEISAMTATSTTVIISEDQHKERLRTLDRRNLPELPTTVSSQVLPSGTLPTAVEYSPYADDEPGLYDTIANKPSNLTRSDTDRAPREVVVMTAATSRDSNAYSKIETNGAVDMATAPDDGSDDPRYAPIDDLLPLVGGARNGLGGAALRDDEYAQIGSKSTTSSEVASVVVTGTPVTNELLRVSRTDSETKDPRYSKVCVREALSSIQDRKAAESRALEEQGGVYDSVVETNSDLTSGDRSSAGAPSKVSAVDSTTRNNGEAGRPGKTGYRRIKDVWQDKLDNSNDGKMLRNKEPMSAHADRTEPVYSKVHKEKPRAASIAATAIDERATNGPVYASVDKSAKKKRQTVGATPHEASPKPDASADAEIDALYAQIKKGHKSNASPIAGGNPSPAVISSTSNGDEASGTEATANDGSTVLIEPDYTSYSDGLVRSNGKAKGSKQKTPKAAIINDDAELGANTATIPSGPLLWKRQERIYEEISGEERHRKGKKKH